MTTRPPHPLTLAYLDHSEMEFARRYAARGRRYKPVPTDKLRKAWVGTFRRAWFGDDDGWRQVWNDLGAEFRLRGLEPPRQLIAREDWTSVAERLNETARHPTVRTWLLDDIRRFLEDYAAPRH